MSHVPYLIPVNHDPFVFTAPSAPPPWVEAVQQQVFPPPPPPWEMPENLVFLPEEAPGVPTRNYKRSATMSAIIDVDATDRVRLRVRRIAGANTLELVPSASWAAIELHPD